MRKSMFLFKREHGENNYCFEFVFDRWGKCFLFSQKRDIHRLVFQLASGKHVRFLQGALLSANKDERIDVHDPLANMGRCSPSFSVKNFWWIFDLGTDNLIQILMHVYKWHGSVHDTSLTEWIIPWPKHLLSEPKQNIFIIWQYDLWIIHVWHHVMCCWPVDNSPQHCRFKLNLVDDKEHACV